MNQFREEFVAEVRSALGVDGYHPNDFVASQSMVDDYKVMTISYRFHKAFSFQIKVRFREIRDTFAALSMGQVPKQEPEGTIHIFVSPGDVLGSEHETCASKSLLFQKLREWVGRINSELLAIPLNRKVAEQQKQLDDLTAQFADLSEGYFSADEADELKRRLDAFEMQFAESIREATENKDEANQRIATLHTEIETLKRQVEALDKSSWTKSALVRVAAWLRDPTNRQLLKSGSDVARTILLPPGQSSSG